VPDSVHALSAARRLRHPDVLGLGFGRGVRMATCCCARGRRRIAASRRAIRRTARKPVEPVALLATVARLVQPATA